MSYPEGDSVLKLDTGTDYVLKLPADRPLRNAQGISINGGRNVVIIGGTVDVGAGYRASGAQVKRAAYFKNAGSVFLEGVRFTSSTGSLTEGIDIASPGATVTLQNIDFAVPLVGSESTNHADVVQAWAGPSVLRVDGLHAVTTYQGFFLLPKQHSSAAVSSAGWDLRRVSLVGRNARYLLWRDAGSYPIRSSDVYLSGSTAQHGGIWQQGGGFPGVTVGTAPQSYGAKSGTSYSSPGYR